MNTAINIIKNLIFGLIATFSLLLQAYVGAVFFLVCVLFEKFLSFAGSKHSVDSLLAEANYYINNKVHQYKELYTNMELGNFKMDWFK
ncbi:MAG: hypothetical protein SFY32_07715 [Bacteroidota bacterium]|nr:hypothetical protein [Bacteroidota bacterium]